MIQKAISPSAYMFVIKGKYVATVFLFAYSAAELPFYGSTRLTLSSKS